IEGASLSSGNDTGVGNLVDNLFYGNGGDDELYGRQGNDQLYGGDGFDRLWGGLGSDLLDGGAGNSDQARYDDDAYAGFRVSLANPSINTGVAAGDVLLNIEWLILSSGDDIAYGDQGDNTIEGRGGNDKLFGGAGSDRLYGEAGHDVLYGGAGADLLDGGAGFDYAAYDDAIHPSFLIALGGQVANTGVAAGDTFVGIESFVLGTGHDVAYGNGADNYIYGRGGNDTLYGKEGHDTLFGEAGADRFIFDTQPLPADSDTIGDFLSGTDKIGLAQYFFGGVNDDGDVRLFQGAGVTGAAVHAYLGAMLFDTASQILSYDADGAGEGAAVQIATLTGVGYLSQSDFFFV
ncbi:MAG TPA: calcium-binding protein, partial [Devosia sp.]|nr:calcium-binding protein [Devosia sp.]